MVGFSYKLSPIKTKTELPIPGSRRFHKSRTKLEENLQLNQTQYVTSDAFFETKFGEIFQRTKLRHNTAAESKRWLCCPTPAIRSFFLSNSARKLSHKRSAGPDFLIGAIDNCLLLRAGLAVSLKKAGLGEACLGLHACIKPC